MLGWIVVLIMLFVVVFIYQWDFRRALRERRQTYSCQHCGIELSRESPRSFSNPRWMRFCIECTQGHMGLSRKEW